VSEPTGVGLIGCGHVAELRHLPALSGLDCARVVAVADLDRGHAQQLGERFAVPRRYHEPQELLADPAVEVVGVLVPATDHAEVTIAALQAGKHVLVEKPLATSLEDGDRMIAAAAETPAKACVGFNLRAHPLVGRARELLSSGVVGTIEAIHGVLSGGDGHDGDEQGDAGKRRSWKTDSGRGGSPLFEKAPHHYDLWRFLTGNEVQEVSALTRRGAHGEVGASISARLSGGALVSTGLVDSPTAINQVTVQGPAGRLEISPLEYDGLRFTPSSSFPGDLGARARRVREALAQLPRGLRTLRQGGEFPLSYRRQWERFLAAVRDSAPLLCELDDGQKALRIALAAVASAAQGRTVGISEAPRDLSAALHGSR
jgi:myo-inositol 2-dehydrogenase/D-chiro-inositol 1-dehydrogenase